MQARNLIARSLGQDFYAAIVIVTHPTGNAKNVGLALHKPAEADALHASADDEAACVNRLFTEIHF